MISIIISDLLSVPDYSELISSIAEKTIAFVDSGISADLSLNLMNDNEIHELNLQYRGIDRPTDVLSFESGEIDPETGSKYLGDIAISYDRVLAQSADAGHPVESEMQLLIIHGILHLLGYDHDTPENKQQMWALQSNILSQSGIAVNRISGDE